MRKEWALSFGALALWSSISAGDEPPLANPEKILPPAVENRAKLALEVPSPCPPAIEFCDVPPAPSAFWFRAEYLWWRVRNAPLPTPLVTFGSDADTPFQGILGQPGTRLAYGAKDAAFQHASGVRLYAGIHLDREGDWSVEGGWFGLARQTQRFNTQSDALGAPVIARPIVNAVTGNENSELISSPLVGIAGSIQISSTTQLQGWEVNVARTHADATFPWSGLFGFRAMDLEESLVTNETFRDVSGVPGGAGLTFLGRPVLTNAPLTGQDRFQVRNQFFGPQVGLRGEWVRDILSLELVGKVAVGWSQQLAILQGESTAQVTAAEGRSVAPSGVLVQRSNSGRHFRNEFAVLPEIGVNVGVQLTPSLRAKVGYQFLYWNHVARPGTLIDRTVNRFNVATDQNFGQGIGPARPAFTFRDTDFWAHGITAGLEFEF